VREWLGEAEYGGQHRAEAEKRNRTNNRKRAMRVLTFLLVALLALISVALSTPINTISSQQTFNSCGNSEDSFHFQMLEVTPDPPKTASQLQVHVKGYLKETIAPGSYALVQVKIGLIKLIDAKFDVCEELPKINMTCPIQPGEQDILRVADIPREVPKVTFQHLIGGERVF
jgi:hypothetical protein